MTDQSPNVFLVQPSFPAKTVQELITLVKSRPGEYNYARAAPAGPTHFSAELFNVMAGLKIVPIPFKGGGPAVIGLLSNQAHMMFAPAAVAMPHVNSGKLRGLAVTTAQPSALFPQLPTMSASGVPGYEYTSWNAMFAPRNTPRAIVIKLHGVLQKILADADVRQQYASQGLSPLGSKSPDEFEKFYYAEYERVARVVKIAGVKPE
jgi:tripartite-type tricarboxylate transporter receptor subunit TctC